MPNTMPTLCMDGFVWLDICNLRPAENCAGTCGINILKATTYNQISTGRKRNDVVFKTGRQRGNTDYESAALTIELRAQTVYLLVVTALIGFFRRY